MKLNNLFFLFFFISLSAKSAEVNLTWPKIDEAVNYEIHIFEKSNQSTPILIQKIKNNFILFDANPGSYSYKIRYFDEYGRWSDFSNLSVVKINKIVKKKVPPPPPIQKPIVKKDSQLTESKNPPQFFSYQSKFTLSSSMNQFKLKLNESEEDLNAQAFQANLFYDFDYLGIWANAFQTMGAKEIKSTSYDLSIFKKFGTFFYPSLGAGKNGQKISLENFEVELDIMYYLFKSSFIFQITEKSKLEIIPFYKIGNPTSNTSLGGSIAYQYSPLWIKSKLLFEMILSHENWNIKSEENTLNISNSQLGFSLGFRF